MAPHFSSAEKLHFLNIMHKILPLGQVVWETVMNMHNEVCEHFTRAVDTLKRQFTNPCGETPPAGDPNVSREVQVARNIKNTMCQRGDIADTADPHNLLDGPFANTSAITNEQDASISVTTGDVDSSESSTTSNESNEE